MDGEWRSNGVGVIRLAGQLLEDRSAGCRNRIIERVPLPLALPSPPFFVG